MWLDGITYAPTMNFKHLTKLGYPGNIYIGLLKIRDIQRAWFLYILIVENTQKALESPEMFKEKDILALSKL